MIIAVNALSATNLSGPSVLLGHLAQLAKWTVGRHAWVVLVHAANRRIRRELGPNVRWLECPAFTSHWLARSLWETLLLPGRLRDMNADLLFSASGTVVSSVRIPQIVLAMNPWALVPEAQRGAAERLKAWLQRRAYCTTVRRAAAIAFLSEFLRDAYRANARSSSETLRTLRSFAAIPSEIGHQNAQSSQEEESEVVYCGMDEDLLARIATPLPFEQRKEQIVSVSLMARHKNVETTVRALAILDRRHKLRPALLLVGGWSDAGYRRAMEELARQEEVADRVQFTGHVCREDLLRYYAESRVFCLMSRCESFGIPAVEAQCFGTPVVAGNCCAPPNICGAGGIYPDPTDAAGTADALAKLLTDRAAWTRYSEAARRNATKYRYETCSKPLMRLFERVGG